MGFQRGRGRVRTLSCWILTICLCVGTGCTSPSAPSRPEGTPSEGPSVSGLPVGHPLSATVAKSQPPEETFIQPLSQVWELGPSGALPNTVQVTLPLTKEPAQGEDAIVGTREAGATAWDYVAARVQGQGVTFSTDHFSEFVVLGISVQGVLDWFKKSWRSGVSQGLLTDVAQPTCNGADQLVKHGYSVTSSGPAVLLACWGQEASGVVLKTVNPHLYPVQIAYGTSSSVLSQRAAGFRFTDLARLGSGRTVLLGPGDSASLAPAPAPGVTTREVASLDGVSLSLYQLQIGFEVAATFLTKFGLDTAAGTKAGVFAVITADDILGNSDCSSAIHDSGAADIWTKCVLKLAVPKLLKALTNPAASAGLAILMTYLLAGDLIRWVTTEGQALAHVADTETIAIARSTSDPSATVTPVTGSWHVHGGQLTITSTTASAVIELGPCDTGPNALFCQGFMDLKPQTLSTNQVKLTFLGFTVKDRSGAVRTAPTPPLAHVGDYYLLTITPGGQDTTELHEPDGSLRVPADQPNELGNPHMCGPAETNMTGWCGA